MGYETLKRIFSEDFSIRRQWSRNGKKNQQMILQAAMLIGTTFLDGKLMKIDGKKCFDPGIPPPRIKPMNLIRDVYGKA